MSATSLNKASIDLLFKVLEARGTQIAGATLTEYFPRAAETLLASGLLAARGQVPVVAAMDAHEDEPIPAVWSSERKAFGYLNSVGRWIEIEEGAISAYQVDHARMFAAMLMPFERQGSAKMTPLIPDHLWDIGSIRMAGARTPVPVWFGRRLGDPHVWSQVGVLVGRRPATERRIILTSTRGDRLPAAPDRRHALVAAEDVLETPDRLAISPRVLAARVYPEQAQRRYPIDYSDDFGTVWLRDETFEFRGDKHRKLLEQLFDAYWAGKPVLRVTVTLAEAGFSDKTNSLSKAFSGRDDWQKFIRQSEGNCWIEV
ncbi:hypothetical protein NOF55_18765 [Rhizobiaceae bacterium BDR2-2]|uniref:Uncharacterized protein n=1 Tax=Ectorhizobium quercum TaxID=2965071 RepID=A0AAE3N3C7_9HYPH|nr:hypothetical protein [Ectorhizobium quercum]MCX8999151.1 hypothetical protein [Ectorhizobium quercum]